VIISAAKPVERSSYIFNYKLNKQDQSQWNFVSAFIIRISSYMLCLLCSKKTKTLLKVIRLFWWIDVTFQFLDGEDTMLLAVSYFILMMKIANGIKTLANQ
jgi:hypothetical protein